MTRQHRTRLNADLASQYAEGGARSVAPGRRALGDGQVDVQDAAHGDDHAGGQSEAAAQADGEPQADVEAPGRDSARSVFDLPRKGQAASAVSETAAASAGSDRGGDRQP